MVLETLVNDNIIFCCMASTLVVPRNYQILLVFFIVLCSSEVIGFQTGTRSVILNSSGLISLDKKIMSLFVARKNYCIWCTSSEIRLHYIHVSWSVTHICYISIILTWLRGGKIANSSPLHCLAIPRRDLSTKKTKPDT